MTFLQRTRHLRSALLAALALAPLACGGSTASSSAGTGGTSGTGGTHAGPTCFDSSACTAPEECQGPDEFPGCGIPPQEHCATSADCGPGAFCHAIADSCSADGVGSACGPPCVADGCGPGFACTAQGACVAVLCTEGATCRSFEYCRPEAIPGDAPVHARHSGCHRIICSGDTPCAEGDACVNGVCHSGPGTCAEPIAVP